MPQPTQVAMPGGAGGAIAIAQNMIQGLGNGLATLVSLEGNRATFAIAGQGLANTATGIIASITGSTAATIKITRAEVSGKANAATAFDVTANIRTGLNSGGTTGSTPVAQLYDALSGLIPSLGITASQYTVSPTTEGTSSGPIRASVGVLNVSASVACAVEPVAYDFGAPRNTQYPTLRGTNQVFDLKVFLPAAGAAGAVWDWSIEGIAEFV